MVLTLVAVVSGVYGLVVGSFLNVVIYRVPAGVSIVSPRSRCGTCYFNIRGIDNIPVVSWLLLHGKCRLCKSRIAPRYMLVESGTGAVFVAFALRFGVHGDLVAFDVFAAALIALSFIDLDHMVLPTKVIYPSTAIVFAALAADSAWSGQWGSLVQAVVTAVVWFAVFALIHFAAPRYLGFGDVRLSLLLGLGLGWLGWEYAVAGLYVAAVVGAVVGSLAIVRHRSSAASQIPFGPFLAIGSGLSIFLIPLAHSFN